jgi:hypothetical protein
MKAAMERASTTGMSVQPELQPGSWRGSPDVVLVQTGACPASRYAMAALTEAGALARPALAPTQQTPRRAAACRETASLNEDRMVPRSDPSAE